ncbi:TonB-dependent receptor [Sphingomonas sp. BT-65]|uniref:TonB-dependent receptor n=1 Tax=Sphingomonas sp. BT-65 TaxID=2989821 RepID=UPI002235FFA2|nr:TonB-dependent receptor [Sphingomonas sp. BT-65]MCW4463831.1 TonB-dependent receptor [Sphingomonas sp. BT-65]
MRNRAILACTTPALGLIAMPSVALAQDAPVTVESAPEDPAVQEEIVVTAIQRSLETSQAIKQDSDQIVDSIVAEDIGKLPDVTATESLARITGVQVEFANGTAAGTRVRGLPDITTTYNGRQLFTGQGRAVALQDFPSSSIARLDVYKSGSANLLEPGIAGLIDVRARKPLDFKGDRIAGGVSGVHWRQSQKLGVDANLLVSKRWDTGIGDIGFLIEGSYTDIKFIDSARNVAQSILRRTDVPGYVGTALRYPSFVNVNYNSADRFRPSVATALQWRPSTELELYADFLFQGYRSTGNGRNFQVNSGQASTLTDITLIPGTNQIDTATARAGGFVTGGQNVVEGKTDTYQGGGGFIWKRDGLRITGDIALTDSTFTRDTLVFNYSTTAPQPTRVYDFVTDEGPGGGSVVVSDINLNDPARYRMTGLGENGDRSHGRDVQARLDLDYRFGQRGLTNLQTGVRFNTRDFDFENYSVSGNAPAGQLYTLLPLQYSSVAPGFRGDTVPLTRVFLTPTVDSLTDNVVALRTLVGFANPGERTPSQRVYFGNEKAYAGYLQGRYAIDLGGMLIDGLVGVRAVRTENQINGFNRVTTGGVTTVTPVTQTNSYTDVLPNFSARLHLTPKLQLRLAYTETRTRPGFGDLNPSLTIGAPSTTCSTDPNDPECVRVSSGGNADLEPIRSQNYDASLEWYFSRSGSLTFGAFNRDVTGFISDFTQDVEDAEFGRLRVTRPFNGGAGRLQGFEAAFRTFLHFPGIPGWARNFGVLANYTYIDHESELPEALAATLPGKQRIAGVSSHIANASIFYDSRWFSTRLSYNYRSEFVVEYNRVADPALGTNVLGPTLPVVEDGRGTIDLNGTIDPTENITLSFSVNNLLGSAATNHRQFNAEGQIYPWQTRFLETIYRLGVRFRF